jgi:hypothetical protein
MGIENYIIPYGDNMSFEILVDWNLKYCHISFHHINCYNRCTIKNDNLQIGCGRK